MSQGICNPSAHFCFRYEEGKRYTPGHLSADEGTEYWKWELLEILKNSPFCIFLLLVLIGKNGLMQSLSLCKIHFSYRKKKQEANWQKEIP